MTDLKPMTMEVSMEPSEPDVSQAASTNALNRRDIELIKRSLATMHKDCAELRSTIVALHGRQGQSPSRGFFIGFALLSLAIVGLVSAARPNIESTLRTMPAFAGTTTNGSVR